MIAVISFAVGQAAEPPLPTVEILVMDGQPKVHTEWIPLTTEKAEIYSSMMGGRVVYGQVKSRTPEGTVTFEISGRVIAFTAQEFQISPKDPGPVTILLTKYPGNGNLSLMYRLQ